MKPLEIPAAKVDGTNFQSALAPIHRCLKQFASYRIWPSLLPIPRDNLAGLRDRALISTMLFSFARVSAVLSLAQATKFLLPGTKALATISRERRQGASNAGPPSDRGNYR
jgi:hypothetical protein